MTVNDFFWIPINLATLWVWSWWFRQRPKFDKPRLRSGAGLVSLLLTTLSSLTLAAVVIGNWINGSFSGITYSTSVGLSLNLAGGLVSLLGQRRFRLLNLGNSVLLALGWVGHLWARRVLL